MYNLSKVTEFCREMAKLEHEANSKRIPIVYRTMQELPKKVNSSQKTNSIVLVGIYLALCKQVSVDTLKAKFSGIHKAEFGKQSNQPTQDSSNHALVWTDYIEAILMAKQMNWYSIESFDLDSYLHFSNFVNGDLNWIVPNEILAFSSPCDDPKSSR